MTMKIRAWQPRVVGHRKAGESIFSFREAKTEKLPLTSESTSLRAKTPLYLELTNI